MRRTKIGSFRKMCRVLRTRCPALVPVRVRRRQIKDLGYTSPIWDEHGRLSHFNITISSDLTWNSTWQVLIHEWAHCTGWTEGHQVMDHGAEWGLSVARCYQAAVAL